MNTQTFLTREVEKSGMQKAEIARALNITPQAAASLISYPQPKPASVAAVLRVLGYTEAEIGALTFATVYQSDL